MSFRAGPAALGLHPAPLGAAPAVAAAPGAAAAAPRTAEAEARSKVTAFLEGRLLYVLSRGYVDEYTGAHVVTTTRHAVLSRDPDPAAVPVLPGGARPPAVPWRDRNARVAPDS